MSFGAKNKTFKDATDLILKGTENLASGELIHLPHFTLMVSSQNVHTRDSLDRDEVLTLFLLFSGCHERDRRYVEPSASPSLARSSESSFSFEADFFTRPSCSHGSSHGLGCSASRYQPGSLRSQLSSSPRRSLLDLGSSSRVRGSFALVLLISPRFSSLDSDFRSLSYRWPT